MSKQIDLAVIPGDGIGPEVVAEGLKVLRAALPPEIATIQTHVFSLGAAHYHKSGEVLSEETLEKIRANDAIFLGAIGDPSVPAGVLERGLLLKLRFALDHSVNLR
ncbi:MAG: isocitrate/isopropylmalate family dehydrogenase, partial [Winkia neuii]